ncbi:hypothetical protein BGW38_005446 [Lunasporangiospora selenospora]|uniref:FAD-binding PCMH-type domain-containing protein n=1 Tax=Lunasporangiospora selenospora TaxID=979761 RepID=A0A9P6FNG7_9FUNG|nr:hypothetical protein BGW38_005446 [Lunasporangiospora selenospora]
MHLSLSLSLIAVVGVTLFTTTPTSAQVASPPKLRCKCLPTDGCWPNEATWTEFGKTVGDRLIATTPVARECHAPYLDQAKCEEIVKGYHKDTWRSLQPGAVMSANWETFRGEGCLLNQTAPCTQGEVPLYTVKALSVADVETTIRFASKHNIRLVVKNTGHDYLGRSTAMNSISLWTHFMKGIKFDDKYTPEGAPAGTEGTDAIILEAGVVWDEAYKAAHENNRMVVGGNHPTVGTSGGFCQSGGHGPLSPRHGLCVDNVLQYKIVTADGILRIANAYQNQDLFWALRGGGPSYGVVVEAVYRTHPPASFVLIVSKITAPDEATMLAISQAFYAHQSQLSKDGQATHSPVPTTSFWLIISPTAPWIPPRLPLSPSLTLCVPSLELKSKWRTMPRSPHTRHSSMPG